MRFFVLRPDNWVLRHRNAAPGQTQSSSVLQFVPYTFPDGGTATAVDDGGADNVAGTLLICGRQDVGMLITVFDGPDIVELFIAYCAVEEKDTSISISWAARDIQ